MTRSHTCRNRRDTQTDVHYCPAGDSQVSEHPDGSVIFRVTKGQFFVTNRAGADLWRDLVRGESAEAISRKLQQSYCMPLATARQDVQEFIDELLRRKLVRRRSLRSKPRYFPVTCIIALFELLKYEFEMALLGFGRIETQLRKTPLRSRVSAAAAEAEEHVLSAVALACSLYCKVPRCLQRSVVLARLLRRWGVPAQVVIGYRAAPFFSHAWVEVDGRVINDSPMYASRLSILHRI